eukprot:3988379-Amphidinium_carterae.1
MIPELEVRVCSQEGVRRVAGMFHMIEPLSEQETAAVPRSVPEPHTTIRLLDFISLRDLTTKCRAVT